jgi:hypothetical protein
MALIPFPQLILAFGCSGDINTSQFKSSANILDELVGSHILGLFLLGDIDYLPQKNKNNGFYKDRLHNAFLSGSLLGNHDIHDIAGIEDKFKIKFIKDSIFEFDFFDIIILNTNSDTLPMSFLGKSNKPFFVFCHHPPIGDEYHHQVDFWKINNKQILSDTNLIAIVSAHEHHLEHRKLENDVDLFISGSFSHPRNVQSRIQTQFMSTSPGFLVFQLNKQALQIGFQTKRGFNGCRLYYFAKNKKHPKRGKF